MRISKNKPYRTDSKLFRDYLVKETQLLKEWFAKQSLVSNTLKMGAEIEFLILDQNYQLLPKNMDLVEKINNTLVVPEAGRSQMEMNIDALNMDTNFLSRLHHAILTLWQSCNSVAEKEGCYLALIGSIPETTPSSFDVDSITPKNDFYIMNDYAMKYRQGRPLSVTLEESGSHNKLHTDSLALEGQICSFQLHLEVNQAHSMDYYNAIQMISAPLLAISSNSPFFYGKKIWSESRISLFEQLYSFPLPAKKTVFFEEEEKTSFFSFFKNNIDFPYLIPLIEENEHAEEMIHLIRQNGCIFRWNRPILDFNPQHQAYLRIEHRPLPSGPTVVDMVANAAFFYGLVFYFTHCHLEKKPPINSHEAAENFYKAAQFGLDALLIWDNQKIDACALLHKLLPLAETGLHYLQINEFDISYYLGVIKKRIINKQNGSIWQQKYIDHYGKDFHPMLEQYLLNQYAEIPVSEWKI